MSPIRRDQQPIYNRLAVLRAEWKLSRAELAYRVGVNVQTIGALERGDHYPSLDLAFRICAQFNLPIEAVFSRQPFVPDPERFSNSTTGSPFTEKPPRDDTPAQSNSGPLNDDTPAPQEGPAS